jgi:hypothetical protein
MPRPKLEERVAELERQVSELLATHSTALHTKDWRRTRGAFTGDELMKQVFDEGQRIRAAERKRSKSQNGKKRQAHS